MSARFPYMLTIDNSSKGMLGKVPKSVGFDSPDPDEAFQSRGSVRKVCVSLSFWDEGGMKHYCG